MKITLRVWRQSAPTSSGSFETYVSNDVSPSMSFLDMLDLINEDLIEQGREPIAFDHDCREGICGSCGFVVNGVPHGPQARKRPPVSCTCESSRTAPNCGSSHGGPPLSPSSKTWSSTGGRSTESSRRVASSTVRTGSAPEANTFARAEGRRGSRRSTPQPASDVGPAWPPVPTRPRCCSPPPR